MARLLRKLAIQKCIPYRELRNKFYSPTRQPVKRTPKSVARSDFEPTPNAGRHEACLQIYEYKWEKEPSDGAGAGTGDEADEQDDGENKINEQDDGKNKVNMNITLLAIHMAAALGETKPKALSEYKKEVLSL
ncbi:hypothetical protein DL98DRAFT_536266 [Cadophora sp. DSE1049]|nr:hypothetical protein DL98DRAFT_536266 [Cadophora sp. DSE1049]